MSGDNYFNKKNCRTKVFYFTTLKISNHKLKNKKQKSMETTALKKKKNKKIIEFAEIQAKQKPSSE